MSRQPRVVVCAGGGGVGKTTSSAALGLALARAGARTLVVTIDPARRLADAMGVALGNDVQVAHLDPAAGGRLLALMPDPEHASRQFMEYLFAEEPAALERLLHNGLFLTLEDKLAGMNELVAMTLVVRAIEEHGIDVVVVDTAPSRYALDFLTYPARLATLLEGRTVKWLGGISGRAQDDDDKPSGLGRFAGWGRRRVEGVVSKVMGQSLIENLSELFSEIARVRKRFAAIAQELGRLLLGRDSRYVLVAAPTGAAEADVEFLLRRLDKLEQKPVGVLLNRSELGRAMWTATLRAAPATTTAILEVLDTLEDERAARVAASQAFAGNLAEQHAYLQIVALPLIESVDPAQIVRGLSRHLDEHVQALTGFKPVTAPQA